MRIFRLISIFYGALLLAGMRCAVADSSLVLGIHPYKAPSKLLSAFGPLADYLSVQLGKPVEIRISQDYQSHIQEIGEDRLDIAYMGPASYIKLTHQYAQKPLLAKQVINGNAYFRGAIITQQNNTLSALSELSGKRFAFGDPGSTMSSLVPRSMLIQAGVHLKGYEFLGSHDNVALAVLSGDFDAGAVKEAVYNKYQPKGLKLVTYTPQIAEHLFVASNRLDRNQVEQLIMLLLDLDKSSRGREVMRAIKPGMTAMIRAEDQDYDTLRDILRTLEKQGGDHQ